MHFPLYRPAKQRLFTSVMNHILISLVMYLFHIKCWNLDTNDCISKTKQKTQISKQNFDNNCWNLLVQEISSFEEFSFSLGFFMLALAGSLMLARLSWQNCDTPVIHGQCHFSDFLLTTKFLALSLSPFQIVTAKILFNTLRLLLKISTTILLNCLPHLTLSKPAIKPNLTDQTSQTKQRQLNHNKYSKQPNVNRIFFKNQMYKLILTKLINVGSIYDNPQNSDGSHDRPRTVCGLCSTGEEHPGRVGHLALVPRFVLRLHR